MVKTVYSYGSARDSRYKFSWLPEGHLLYGSLLASALIPFAFHSAAFTNQLFVGTIVNALLAGSALYLGFRKSIPLMVVPSLAALFSGLVFGPFTVFLALLVPFIWLGNAIYVHSIERLKVVNRVNYGLAVLASSFFKAAFIGASAFLLFYAGLIPFALVAPMSVVQFATAVLGGLLAGATLYLKN